MHILITADTVGGVWTYTRELASGLVGRGHRVTLVSFGKFPTAEQLQWMAGLPRFQYRPTEFRLEWMQDCENDIAASMDFLDGVIDELQPDLLHLNQYSYGALKNDVPRIVVGHSDVVSWWVSVHGEEPPGSPWMRWYREIVARGLRRADLVVTPSEWMMDQLESYYVRPACTQVIHNGRSPQLFDPNCQKEDVVLAVGRVWDQGKQISLLLKEEHALPVCIAGSQEHPDKLIGGYANCGERTGVTFCGPQSEGQLRQLYARASAYAATASYEPFGLAPVEAALSRCALIANDLPVFHELWGDAAFYFEKNDSRSLAEAISLLSSSPRQQRDYAERGYRRALERFTTDRMISEYEKLYCHLVRQGVAA
jgi:glycosyltransferase involved in cell wall biosynthesis